MSAGMTSALWDLGRASGIVALIAFTASVVLGIVSRSGRELPGLGRFGTNEVHRTVALTAVGMTATHLISLFFDPYAQLRLVDFVFPFLGSYRPFWLGLGTVAVDLLLVVTVVSLLRDKVGPAAFRAVHWATYALWPVALFHALGTGTNAWTLWMDAIAAGSFVAVFAAVWWRLDVSFAERGRVRVPRAVAR